MNSEVSQWILYFLIYSVLGYLVEVTLCSIQAKKLVNRGFLFGPWLPIYGWGMVFVLLSTLPVRENLALTFLVATLVCSVLEYLTSWAMEKLFHIKWWDYSESEKFNLNGRICLRNCLAFGIAGSIVVYQIQPLVEKLVSLIPTGVEWTVAIIFLVIFLLDTVASVYAVLKAKGMVDFEKIVGDQTNEVKRAARRAIAELFRRKKKFEKDFEKKVNQKKKELEKRLNPKSK